MYSGSRCTGTGSGKVQTIHPGLGVAERRAAVLDGDTLDTAGKVGLPVLALGELFLRVGEVVPPAELLQHLGVELGIAVLDFRADAVGALGEQVHAVALHTETGTEIEAAVGHRLLGS